MWRRSPATPTTSRCREPCAHLLLRPRQPALVHRPGGAPARCGPAPRRPATPSPGEGRGGPGRLPETRGPSCDRRCPATPTRGSAPAAHRRRRPCTATAWAPKRYQGTFNARKARASAASGTSTLPGLVGVEPRALEEVRFVVFRFPLGIVPPLVQQPHRLGEHLHLTQQAAGVAGLNHVSPLRSLQPARRAPVALTPGLHLGGGEEGACHGSHPTARLRGERQATEMPSPGFGEKHRIKGRPPSPSPPAHEVWIARATSGARRLPRDGRHPWLRRPRHYRSDGGP